MITGGSTLDPGFPTWGTMLREHGYHTRWYGKWHLTHHDGNWGRARGERALARYGFAGGTFPSPNGAPGQGWQLDGHIAKQFAKWFKHERRAEPWCTTVSFVNPHDIAWWYVWSNRVAPEASAQRGHRRAAAQLRDARADGRAQQAPAAALTAGHGGCVVWPRALRRPRS